MEIKVLNIEGKETGRSIQLENSIFAIEPNDHSIYRDVKQILANRRQGTHKSKQRNEISGSTRKLKRQKGTGTARAGSIKSPLFRGGGRIFGPVPRDYSFKLNKKVNQLARKSALAYKVKGNALMVVEDINFDAPRTKEHVSICNNLNISDKKALLLLGETNRNIYLSSNNLQKQFTIIASSVTPYNILNAVLIALTGS